MEDWELVAAYAQRGDNAAFTTLVERHRDWVYWACVRRLGNSGLAEDAAQGVFVVLARHAGKLARKGSGLRLEGWLHEAVRMAAANVWRAERRRKEHEMEAAARNREAQECGAVWQDMESRVEPALDRLSAGDREAILMRFYRHMTHAEIGGRLAISEEAATKRVTRALERLREVMAKGGVDASAMTMGAALWAHAVGPVSAGVAAKLALAGGIAGAAGVSGQAAAIAQGVLHMIHVAELKMIALVAAAAAIVVTTPLVMAQRGGNPAAEAPPGGSAAVTPVVSPASDRAMPAETKLEDPTSWIPQVNGCAVEQTGTKLRIRGTNNIDGWGHGNGVVSTKILPEGDFYACIDFMVPRFQEGAAVAANPPAGGRGTAGSTSGQALVYLRAKSTTGNMVAILYQPKGGTYQVQGWSTPNNVFSQPQLKKVGDEDTVYHRLKLKYEAATKTAAGWVDDRFIGSIQYAMSGAITFELLGNTEKKGMEIDLCFDNYTVSSDISGAPTIPGAPGRPESATLRDGGANRAPSGLP
jgi:RNA polymerase sigma factor (sigma-70 family)